MPLPRAFIVQRKNPILLIKVRIANAFVLSVNCKSHKSRALFAVPLCVSLFVESFSMKGWIWSSEIILLRAIFRIRREVQIGRKILRNTHRRSFPFESYGTQFFTDRECKSRTPHQVLLIEVSLRTLLRGVCWKCANRLRLSILEKACISRKKCRVKTYDLDVK